MQSKDKAEDEKVTRSSYSTMQAKEPDGSRMKEPPAPRVLKNIVAMAVLHNSLYVSDGDAVYCQSGGKFRPVSLEIADD